MDFWEKVFWLRCGFTSTGKTGITRGRRDGSPAARKIQCEQYSHCYILCEQYSHYYTVNNIHKKNKKASAILLIRIALAFFVFRFGYKY